MKLEINDLSKWYGKKQNVALDHISLGPTSSQTLAFIGPSGGGKSTLIRLIAGLEKPDTGSITLLDQSYDNESISKNSSPSLGIVFQALNLFPHLTALENIVLPLVRVHGYNAFDAEECAMGLLKRFQLQEHAHKKPSQLSGGQSQRVAIVRAVAHKPSLLALDEPTSALDPVMTSEVLDLIMELKNEGCQLILASHHLGFVKKVADHVLFLSDAKIVDSGPAKEFFSTQRSPEVQGFLENILKY
jgi:polar amino acid transport system ATP-binding protein